MQTPSLSTVTAARSRSVSPENVTGGKGAGGGRTEGTGAECARDLGVGWKISPSIEIGPGETVELADVAGPGVVTHLWLTTHRRHWREAVLRAYWDGAERPAVAVPVGDFFCQGWGEFAQVSSQTVAVNPNGGFNAYWEMPFRRRARLTVENLGTETMVLYYQLDYELREIDADAGYLHATWRRSNPLPYRQVHTLLDGVSGAGHYVGTYLAWGVNSSGWWGEGELKFYLDGDDELPTICGTGTEDYFGGAWNFDVPGFDDPAGRYTAYTTPFLGLPQVIEPDGRYRSQERFGMYRWHVPDPVRFGTDLRVTVQALGWRSGRRYLPLQDDIASTCWWYLDSPAGQQRDDFTADELEIC